jgi:membrane associated rhomboid family serine protease
MLVCERLGFVAADPSFVAALSSLLLHDPDDVSHVLGNVVVLLVVGSVVEREIGGWRLVALFVGSGLGGAAMHLLVTPGSNVPLVGASGAVMGLSAVGAIARSKAMLAFVVSYMGLNVLCLFVDTPLFPTGTSLASHVGGFSTAVGCLVLGRLRAVGWATA